MYAQTPRANLLWALFCLAAAFLYTSFLQLLPIFEAEQLADALASRLDVPRPESLRILAETMEKSSLRKALVFSAPWLLMSTLYASRAWMQFLESDEDEEVFSPLPEGHVTSE